MANNRTWSANAYVATETAFNTWGKSISDSLAIVGMTNVYRARGAVTGSAAWTTEVGNWQSGSYNNEKVVEVWTFPTSPALFVRIGYGQGNGYQIPRMTVRVGKTHDGSGNVAGLGNFTNQNSIVTVYSHSNSNVPYWLSCDDNGLALVMNAGDMVSNNYTGNNVLVIDRYRDTNGSPLNTGAMMFQANGYASSHYHFDMIENDGWQTSVAPCVTRGNFTTSVTNAYLNAYGQTQIYPWWSAVRSGHGVSKMICTYAYVDRPVATNQSVAWLTTATNRVIRTGGIIYSGNYSIDMFGASGSAFAIWWND